MTLTAKIIIAIIFIIILIPYVSNTLKLKKTSAMIIPEQGKHADLSNGKIFYRWHEPKTISSEEIIILVHGFSTPSFVWNGILDDLLSTGKRVLVFDHYGRGFSDRPNVKYDLNLYVSTLEELLKKLNIDNKIHIVGYSMGGPIAADFSSRNNKKISSLSLIAPAGYMPKPPWYFNAFTLPVLGDYIFRAFPSVFKAISASETLFSNDPKSINEDEFNELFSYQTKFEGFTDALLSTIRNSEMINASDIYKRINMLEIKSSVIWGTQDQVVPISGLAKLQKDIPYILFKEIKEGTHDITYRQPTQVGSFLKEFIEN